MDIFFNNNKNHLNELYCINKDKIHNIVCVD